MLSLLLLLLLNTTEKAVVRSGSHEPLFTLDTNLVDYDSIPHAANGYREVYFTNTGNATLIIHDVKSSCGCLVPYGPKEPIPPGKRNKIGMRYDTNRVGLFQKTVTVITNEPEDKNIHVIRVRGYVSPVNAPAPIIYNKP